MRWLLFVSTLPWTLSVSYPWILLLRALGLVERLEWRSHGVLTAVLTPKAARVWRYSTTIGRAIAYQPAHRSTRGDPPTYIEQHEAVHVRQVEDLMLLSLLVGAVVGACTGAWGLALGVWWSGGAWQLPGFITALLRGGNAYRDSEHERAAYAQTELPRDGQRFIDRNPI